MSLVDLIKTEFNKIPKSIVRFSLKALILFIAWQIIYTKLLLPDRIIDKPLSFFTGKTAAVLLNYIYDVKDIHTREVLYHETYDGVKFTYLKTVLYWGNDRLIGIADACNGLSLYVLFLGFIIIYPARVKFKLLFSINGLIIIVIVNILRVVGLIILAHKYASFFPFAHHYLYKIITYAVVFGLWVWFIKIQEKKLNNA
jgi:exosortase/archaeosortase family protein